MALRDAVKVVSKAKPHVSRSIARIAQLTENGSARALRALDRERRFLNAMGFSVQAQIRGAIQGEVAGFLSEEELDELEELAEDTFTLQDLQRIRGEVGRLRAIRARRLEKLGDKAVRRIAREGVSAKAPLMAEFSGDSMESVREARAQAWVWTANNSACAVCLSLHGSRREGPFNPPHPGCLCFPERPGISRPLTDDEIADQMIRRGGRDADLGRALKSGDLARSDLSVRSSTGIIKQRNRNIPKVDGPTPRYRNNDFLDRVGSAEAEEFYSGFSRARAGEYGAFLSDFDSDYFANDNVRVYTAYDGKVGAALTDHGDGRIEVGSLFADSDAPEGAGRDMLRFLVRERDANWLNNFDGPLTEFYRDEGFEVVERLPFDPEFAPEGWDYERFGRPDYVEMQKVRK